MRIKKLHFNKKIVGRKIDLEDLRYLQKKVTGKNVYSHLRKNYNRVSKHKKKQFGFEF